MEEARARARRLAREALARDDATGWFEEVYAGAGGDPHAIQWADMVPNPGLVEWLEREDQAGDGRAALVVGCGLGDDAEELQRRGYRTVAFDIASTAITWACARFPDSAVTYTTADLLAPPAAWLRAFDLVVEIYTLQVLPPPVRRRAIERLADLVAPGGALVVICRGRDPEDDAGAMPWPVLRAELDHFLACGLSAADFEDYIDGEGVRRFRAVYRAG